MDNAANNEAIIQGLKNPDRPKEREFPQTEEIQQEILAALFGDLDFLKHNRGRVKPEYFTNKANTAICRALYDHFDLYGTLPTVSILNNDLAKSVKPEGIAVARGTLAAMWGGERLQILGRN